jgi:aspartate/methionine/tyrosine aminotransferase
LPLREELDFSFSLEDLNERLGMRTELVIINSPNNPTGGVVPAEGMPAVAELILDSPACVRSGRRRGRAHRAAGLRDRHG